MKIQKFIMEIIQLFKSGEHAAFMKFMCKYIKSLKETSNTISVIFELLMANSWLFSFHLNNIFKYV